MKTNPITMKRTSFSQLTAYLAVTCSRDQLEKALERMMRITIVDDE